MSAATIRPDWKRPEPPPGEGWILSAYLDEGNGWDLHWSRERDGEEEEEYQPLSGDPWPFVEDEASTADVVAAGFRVIL